MTDRFHVEKLNRSHSTSGFECGAEAFDRYLVRYAFMNQQANASQTYVGLKGSELIGYYSLVVGEVSYGDGPERLRKGLARHPIPLMILARLAVVVSWQGKGIGTALLRDAMLRTMQASDIAGIRALAAHAKDDAARQFYERFGFIPSPADPLHLYLLIKDLRENATVLA